jgi:hypothetical protein
MTIRLVLLPPETQIDVDCLLAKKKADAFIWHDDHFAYGVAFTEEVSKKIHQKAQVRLGLTEDSAITAESVYQPSIFSDSVNHRMPIENARRCRPASI